MCLGAASFINSTPRKTDANVSDQTQKLHFRTPDGVMRCLEVIVFDTTRELQENEEVLWHYSYGKEIHGYDARTLLNEAQLREFIPDFCA